MLSPIQTSKFRRLVIAFTSDCDQMLNQLDSDQPYTTDELVLIRAYTQRLAERFAT